MKGFGAYCLIILTSLIIACTGTDRSADSTLSKDTIKNQKPTDTIGDEETISTIASEILTTLKAKDYKAFAAYFHPTEGVVFSPYGFIDTKTSKKLTKATFLKLIEEHGSVIWGSYDGSGETIRLTAQQYLDKFVYNADYINAEKTAYNQIIGKGNSLNNLNEIFPQYPFVEYHFSGFDKKYEGMDWTSLRLVFKLHQSNYYLVAVVHDQWTT
ncbi:MAG: hypothetical protein REI64_06065 [Pedobacter sp.]|uniref:hypothetical protein n=1 Tax=Pedobacter sp. TaxID=1411316 RepID=UPI0028091FED|nr:hypothetical protein [Pedobacter sp.]MDQ8004347.1 hypothetical protein [Pedobacter sp.]